MTDSAHSAKVVLIGGPLTVDDGSSLDSRQPVDGDDASQVMRRSLATSWLWWSTTSSLVMPILESAGPDAFALVIGDRSIIELRSDGSIKRTGLRALLPGGTGIVRVHRTYMRHDELPPGFEEVTTLRAWNGQSLGKLGLERTGATGSRWRFLDGNQYYLKEVGPHINPAVIVDTSDLLTAPTELPADNGLSRLPRDDYSVARFRTLEQRRLFGSVVLILPHTHRTEIALRGYAEWVQSNRPEASLSNISASRPPWDPAAPPDPVHYTRPVPIEAEFRVTGLVENARWQSPDDLEAARSLLAARFDLRIGVWDLVSNPLLRQTLLDTTPADSAPTQTVRIPYAAAQRAEVTVARKATQRREEVAVLQTIRGQAGPLLLAGWQFAHGPGLLMLPLTEQVRRWSPDEVPFPLVYLTLTVVKRETYVLARTIMYNQVDLPRYVSARRGALEQIAQMELPNLDKMWPVLWRGNGGWGDEVDWRARFEDLAVKTVHWVPLFADIVAECRRIHTGRTWTA